MIARHQDPALGITGIPLYTIIYRDGYKIAGAKHNLLLFLLLQAANNIKEDQYDDEIGIVTWTDSLPLLVLAHTTRYQMGASQKGATFHKMSPIYNQKVIDSLVRLQRSHRVSLTRGYVYATE